MSYITESAYVGIHQRLDQCENSPGTLLNVSLTSGDFLGWICRQPVKLLCSAVIQLCHLSCHICCSLIAVEHLSMYKSMYYVTVTTCLMSMVDTRLRTYTVNGQQLNAHLVCQLSTAGAKRWYCVGVSRARITWSSPSGSHTCWFI